MSASYEDVTKALRTSLKEAERLRRQNNLLLGKQSEPIAIVGLSCRYPGGVRSAGELWGLLAGDGDAIGEFPDDRGWDVERLYDPDPERSGKSYVREGGFLHEVADFDPAFFGIGPREALAMDPQQGLLLEGAWEALEEAGIDPASLRGSATGVFAGMMYHDYAIGGATSVGAEIEAYLGTGLPGSVASGRIAYTLGLEGPAVTVDTACSSSLVAMHLAAQALRSGECELALAGGVAVMATPAVFIHLSRQRALARDGRCKSFAGAADGTGWGEGMGLVLLERLSDAKRNKRRILAVIRGSATNQDGASNGLTAPNGPSQERVIRQALANAGLKPAEVDAVEAHGTGTVLGDPIEAQALLATYGQERDGGAPLALGSLKSNIGHTQAAAGVGGVIKMAMALREEALPKTLHVDEPTPHVDWEAGEIELLTEQREWKRGDRPRRAGISSFGISGTNAHLILEEAPEQEAPDKDDSKRPPVIPWALSAKAPEALSAMAGRLAAHTEAKGPDPLDVAHTLLNARASLPHRAVIVGKDTSELLEGLDALAAGKEHPRLVRARATSRSKLAFCFPGQGSQWPGMAAELLEDSEAFAASMTRCEQALSPHLQWSVLASIRGGEGAPSLERIEVVQPALFAVMVSLAELWQSFGVKPGAVIGHSQGEIAAAVVAGALSLEDGAKLAALRSQAIAKLVGQGAMVSAAASTAQIEELLAGWSEGEVSLAATNSPTAITLACDSEALAPFLARCEQEGIRAREVAATIPSHSHHVEPLKEEVLEVLQSIEPQEAKATFYSTVTGTQIEPSELTPAYWYRNLREPVAFEQGARALLEDGFTTFIEQSSHPVLAMALQETAEAATEDPTQIAILHSLRREEGGSERFLASLAQAHAAGVAVDFAPLFKDTGATTTDLPTYPFQRQRYWLEASAGASDPASLGQSATEHPLLGAAISLARENRLLLTGRVSRETHPWVADHAVTGTVLLPGTAFAELALRAGSEVGAEHLEELVLEAPLLLPEEGAVQLQVTVSPSEPDPERFAVEIHSRPEDGAEAEEGDQEPQGQGPWTRHAQGSLIAQTEPLNLGFDATAWPPPGAEPLEIDAFYDLVADAGIEYGPAFQGMEAAWRLGGEIFVEVSLAEEQRSEAERFGVHPALLDAAGHPAFLGAESGEGVRLPFSFAGVSLGEASGASSLRVRVRPGEERISLAAADTSGTPVCSIDAFVARPVDPERLRGASSRRDPLLVVGWSELESPERDGGEVEVHRVAAPAASGDRAAVARELSAETLGAIQSFLAAGHPQEARLAIVTEGATAIGDSGAPDPALGAVWGLVRSAQAEHPGRFLLIDSDGSEASEAALEATLEIGGEPELALRGGVPHTPRLERAVEEAMAEAPPLDPAGTVLITGGLTGLGAVVARHFARSHGAGRMLLVSRRGPDAPGAEELISELAGHGCEATAVACDASRREQLEELIEAIPAEHPLTAVVHCAAGVDNGLVEDLSPERFDAVLGPKAAGAWHLHDLTKGMDLAAFVLFSSTAALFSNPAQGSYAAANAFLDGLARLRRAEGLAATAVAWGLWLEGSELGSGLSEAALARVRREGFVTLSTEQVLELLDRARALGEPHCVAASFDLPALRALARAAMLPSLLAGLVPAGRRRPGAAAGSLGRRLAGVPEAEREALVLEVVREHVAAVLGHSSSQAIEPDAAFKDLGFDSLGAVELRNRLAQGTGVRLEATVVFDYPTPRAVAGYLREQVEGGSAGAEVVVRAARGSDEPVAIVGISCRFPGGVSSAEQLWRLVASGEDAISEFPEDRGWDVERIYDPDPERSGKTYTRHGGFLDDSADFDPAFFGIGPRETLAMDPQQRLLLEGAWETLEDAGIDPASLRGSSTGVFAGMMYHDYLGAGFYEVAPEYEPLLGLGAAASAATGRVSYTLGLEGPAVTVDTACSSSMVATHLAAQALRSGECELALAGGVTVMSTPRIFVEFSRQRVLAPDSRCKAFAGAADGAGWSEGAGLLLLERLSDAKRNKRRILAVIRGSATNQDGASNGLTAPNGPSQERVIRQALANAGLKPAEVDAVEAHGTGTVLGDPIEAQALLATYGQERDGGAPLALGSLKSNIGHTQAAAGVGGVIKMAMALREEALPKTLHVDEPTPHVDWEAGEIELLTEQRPWPKSDRPRRVGISSFGMSGTNAHLILEEAPEQEAPHKDEAKRPPALPWALSAKSPEALAQMAGRLAAHAEAKAPDPLDVAHTLLHARASLPHRAVIVGKDTAELLAGLDALATGKSAPNLALAKATQAKSAFCFSGQGSQRAQMGMGLYEAFPVYAESFDQACEALQAELGLAVKDAVFAQPGTELAKSLDRTDLTQASLFATQLALYELLASFGVKPDFLIGHSIGEISAAQIAGVLSLQDAAKLVAARGRLMAALPEGGAMASVRATEPEVTESLVSFKGRLTIAAINAPASITVSGDEDALSEWEAAQAEAEHKTKRLSVSHAFHSQRMEPMLEEFEQIASTLSFNAPQIPIVSNLTREELSAEQATSPAYWAAQVREAVRFGDGIAYLKDQGVSRFLELGPDAVLTAIAQECLPEAEGLTFAATLRRERAEPAAFISALGAMHAAGAKVDFSPLFKGTGATNTELPTYPFQRQRYWLEASPGQADPQSLGLTATEHPFLGASIALAGEGSHLLTGRISQKTHPWLGDHAVAGTAILPATGFAELALRAGAEVGAGRLEELVLEAPLSVPAQGAAQLQITLTASAADPERFKVEIHSRLEASEEADEDQEAEEQTPWTRHASGSLIAQEQPLQLGFDASAWPPPGAEPLAIEDLYELVAEAGLDYGPAFQGLEAAWRLGGEIFAEVSLAEEQRPEAERFAIHPALLDAAGHAALIGADPSEGVSLPFSFAGMAVGEARGASAARVRVRLGEERAQISLADQDGTALCEIESLALRKVDPAALKGTAPQGEDLFRVEWVAVEPEGKGVGEGVAVHRIASPDSEEDTATAAHRLGAEALAALQAFLAEDGAEGSRLAIVTSGAMTSDPGEVDPALASVWGLVRSAQAEHPGRFLLIDSDGSEASEAALAQALASREEPALGIRAGALLAPRLTPVSAKQSEPTPLDPERTILITGALSGLGALSARHLADAHGAKHLLLASRRGPAAPGAKELLAELAELGCEATAVACDAADRAQLQELLAGVPTEHPLGAVFHCAGVLDDGLIADLDPERLGAVLAPKADAAWRLHELTRELELSHFVLYSSIAGSFESPGQGNYAAANAFLDALARRRAGEGLAATAIAWGPWEQATEMTAELGEAERGRLARLGLETFDQEVGLARLDAALAGSEAALLSVRLIRPTLRKYAQSGMLPRLLSGLVPVRRSRARGADSSLARRLAALPEAERKGVALLLVKEQVAAVLGHGSPDAIDSDANFKDLGFDSLGAVELRNLLEQASGIRLDATLVFDHPTPVAVAGYLLGQVGGEAGAATVRAARSSEEPIAIVGIGCRYPGGASSPEEFWRMLAAGRSGISEFPGDRGWETDRIYDPDPERTGKTYARHGGFLHDAGEFDPAFFAIGPREALAMDPQQRLLLEGAWEALEDAGIDPASLQGSATGVFAGMMHHDYAFGLWDAAMGSSPELEGFVSTGNGGSVASGRVSYTLGLEGPAVTVDTACSASLVALHLAAQSLRSGECELALAGGATVLATPAAFIEFSRQRVLAADGRCKSFAGAADGTGWSEGMGLVLLERLSDAKRNGRLILAVIRGSATNQDGASNGLTAPNGPSQERVIRQALANAGLKPAEVDAVEAHGTGTVLGDPIEAQALLATYGQERDGGAPLALGSLKSNIGHTQAAAGVGGVIKMAMALREEALPKTLHVDEPTPHVDWEAGEIELLTEQREWKRGDRPRRAGISSFGISGTNAHLILEEAPAQEAPDKDSSKRPPVIPWALSAKAPEALSAMAGRLAAHAEAKDPDPLDVAHTLLHARASLPHRAVIVGKDTSELLEGLDALAAGKEHPRLVKARATSRSKLAFCFPGQGSQWPGMAAELLASSEAFAASMTRCEAALDPHVEFSLTETLRSQDDAWLSQVEVVQPALFALMVSLAELWQSFGVKPGAVIGHSQGEIAAAVVAGALSLEDGAKLAALRAKALTPLMGKGEMASFALSAAEVEELIAPYAERVSLAARNGPKSTVCSGEPKALEELIASCEQAGKRARLIAVGYASHCAQIEQIAPELKAAIAAIEPKAAQIPIYSTLSGTQIEGQELTPAYWYRNLREPVAFEQATRQLLADGFTTFIEQSSHPVLAMALQETAEAATEDPTQIAILHSLRREEGGSERFLTSLAQAHAEGVAVDFTPLFKDTGATTTDLPTYPFQRQRYWHEASRGAGDPSSLGQSATEHPLLAASISLVGEGSHLFTGRISQATHPWLADHAVAGTVLLPGTAFVELALRVGAEVGVEHLEELVLEAPLLLPGEGAVQLRVAVSPSEPDPERFAVEIHSRPEGTDQGDEDEALPWVRHAIATLSAEEAPELDFDPIAWPPPGAEPVEIDAFYDLVAAAGIEYGPAFQGLEAAWKLGGEIFAEISLAEEQRSEAERFGIHPALLDAAGHAAILGADEEQGLKLPFSFGGVSLGEAQGASALRLRVRADGERNSLQAAHPDGTLACSIESLRVRAVDPAQLGGAGAEPDDLFDLEWRSVDLADPTEPAAIEVHHAPKSPPGDDRAQAAHDLTAWALERIQASLAAEGGGDDRLAFVTEAAVSPASEGLTDPAAAAIWGLVRSAQNEHPGRFLLVDSDGSDASESALAAALAQEDEPQLAIREGVVLVPRLTPVPAADADGEAPQLDPEGTVLITGGLSGIGALTARHLAESAGAKHLLLASRRGPDSPGAQELIAELAELGCEATALACDASEREQLEGLLAQVPAAHPLTAVLHCAGALDDGLVADLDPERLDAVLAPKADAAWHLHELTRELELSHFVLYSSGAGTFGNPGQGNYAAANCFLDALAQRRRAEGLAATSIGWGLWEEQSELTARASEADRARMSRGGLATLTTARGLRLFDRACARPASYSLAVPLEIGALRALARAGMLPPLLSGLVPLSRRRSRVASDSLARRLAGVAEGDREALVSDLVCEHVAAVLGHASAAAVDPGANFKDLGFDSLGAVELRNRLTQATGLRLEATLVFDYPTPDAVAAYLLGQVEGEVEGGSPVEREFDRLEAALANLVDGERDRLVARLRSFNTRCYELVEAGAGDRENGAGEGASETDFELASDDELFELIDREVGE